MRSTRALLLALLLALPAVPLTPTGASGGVTGGQAPTHHPQACTDPFTDVACGDPFFAEIAWSVAEAIATGHADGTYRPTAPVTRRAVAALLNRAAGGHPGPVHPPGSHDRRAGSP
jgi:hypothetical protein